MRIIIVMAEKRSKYSYDPEQSVWITRLYVRPRASCNNLIDIWDTGFSICIYVLRNNLRFYLEEFMPKKEIFNLFIGSKSRQGLKILVTVWDELSIPFGNMGRGKKIERMWRFSIGGQEVPFILLSGFIAQSH